MNNPMPSEQDTQAVLDILVEQIGVPRTQLTPDAKINADLLLIINEANKFVPGFMKVSAIEKIIFNTNKIPVMCINPENYTTIA